MLSISNVQCISLCGFRFGSYSDYGMWIMQSWLSSLLPLHFPYTLTSYKLKLSVCFSPCAQLVWIVAFSTTFIVGLDIGLLVGVLFSLAFVVLYTIL